MKKLLLIILLTGPILGAGLMKYQEPIDREAAALERFNAILDWKEAMRVSDKGRVEKMPRQPDYLPSSPDCMSWEGQP